MGELIRICGWCKKDLDEIQDKTRKQIPGEDRISHGLCRSCGKSVFDFTDEDLDEFEKEEISNADDSLHPVALMRLTQIEDPDELLKDFNRDDIIIEEKLDGWKTQVIKSGGKVKIYSRKGDEKTDNFPELVKKLSFLPDGTMVEGELVYWEKNKQDESKVTSLAGSTPENSIQKAKELPGKMKVHFYDILWNKGKNVSHEPFEKRRKMLEGIVETSEDVKITKQYPFSDWQNAMNTAVEVGGEGIVLKIKSKPYEYKKLGENEPKPAGVMYKYKGGVGKSETDDYVIYDSIMSDKGKLKALFGQYYKGKLYGISEISNFSEENEKKIKDKLNKGQFVVELGFQERQPGGLRHQKFVRFREDKDPKDATMNEFHVKHLDNFDIAKKASLIVNAGYIEEMIRALQGDHEVIQSTQSGLRQVPDVDVQKAFDIFSKLESSKTFAVGDSGTSFGKTQVQIGSFLKAMAVQPNVQNLTGISPKEMVAFAEEWKNQQQILSDYRWKKQTTLDPREIRKIVTANPNKVYQFIDFNALGSVGLKSSSKDRVINVVQKAATWNVIRNGIARVLAYQKMPQLHEKIMNVFSSKNVNNNPQLLALTDRVSQDNLTQKIQAVANAVKKYGYNTNAPGAYNIYQLIGIANSGGVGPVETFLKTKKPFPAGNLFYLKRANPEIERATGISTGMPPNDGLGGFMYGYASSSPMISKRAGYSDPGFLYFPSQYADDIKAGKRKITIRASDVPVEPSEIVKCMTYSGSPICDVRINSKNRMSLSRIEKAYGKRMAKSLEQQFGPKGQFTVIRFEPWNVNEADDGDDESKWKEVLIDKYDIDLTREEIKKHYNKPSIRKKIMARIKDKPILIYIGVARNESILKRNHDGKPIIITNDDPEKKDDPNNYFYWVDRRLLSIHEVFGNETDLGFVDLDLHGDFSIDKAKKYAKEVSQKIKEKYDVTPTIYQSGGSGLHIEFDLKEKQSINKLRSELKDMLDELNENWEDVTTSTVKGTGMRSDVSTLHNKGSLRVPGSLGETYGKEKKAIGEADSNDLEYGILNTHEEQPFTENGAISPAATISNEGAEGYYYAANDFYLDKNAMDKLNHIWRMAEVIDLSSNGLMKTALKKAKGPIDPALEYLRKHDPEFDESKYIGEDEPYDESLSDVMEEQEPIVEDDEPESFRDIITKRRISPRDIGEDESREDDYSDIVQRPPAPTLGLGPRVKKPVKPTAELVPEEEVSKREPLSKRQIRPKPIKKEKLEPAVVEKSTSDELTDLDELLGTEPEKEVGTTSYTLADQESAAAEPIAAETAATYSSKTPEDDEGEVTNLDELLGPDDKKNKDTEIPSVLPDQGKEGKVEPEKVEYKILTPVEICDIEGDNWVTPCEEVYKMRDVYEEFSSLGKSSLPKGDEPSQKKNKKLEPKTLQNAEESRNDSIVSAVPVPEKAELKADDINEIKKKLPPDLNKTVVEAIVTNVPAYGEEILGSEYDDIEEFMELVGDDEEEEKPKKGKKLIFGAEELKQPFRTYTSPDGTEKEVILDRWPETKDYSAQLEKLGVSKKAAMVFNPTKMTRGSELRKIFLDETGLQWQVLKEEPHLAQYYILPNLISALGKSWFDRHKDSTTLPNLPFGLWGANVEDNLQFKNSLSEGVKFEDTPQGKAIIMEINQVVTKYANKYFSMQQATLPIDAYIYDYLDKDMRRFIGNHYDYEEKKLVQCAVCRTERKEGNSNAVMSCESGKKPVVLKDIVSAKEERDRMKNEIDELMKNEEANAEVLETKQVALKEIRKKITRMVQEYQTERGVPDPQYGRMSYIESTMSKKPRLWECPNCRNIVGEIDGDISSVKIRRDRIQKEVEQLSKKSQLSISEQSELEDKKLQIQDLNNNVIGLRKKQQKYRNQLATPRTHTWCPEEACPGQRVPLTSIDWENEFWKTADAKETVKLLKKEYGIDAPKDWASIDETQNAEDDKEFKLHRVKHFAPAWLQKVPFVCPHDGVKFTMESAMNKGYKQRAGYLWDPWQKSFWQKSDDAQKQEFSELGLDEKDAQQQIKVLNGKFETNEIAGMARNILINQYYEIRDNFLKKFSEFNSFESALGNNAVLGLFRNMALYDALLDFSNYDRASYVGWLSRKEIEGQETKQEGDIDKKLRETKREEIIVPVLQRWVDVMMKRGDTWEEGLEQYSLTSWLVNEKKHGVRSKWGDTFGTFFIVRPEDGTFKFEMMPNLGEGKGTDIESSQLRILKILNAYKIDKEQMKLFSLNEIKGQVDIKDRKVIDEVIKGKDNFVSDILSYGFHSGKIESNGVVMSGDYVLIHALLIDGQYKHPMINAINFVRTENDKDGLFAKLGELAKDHDFMDDIERDPCWREVNKLAKKREFILESEEEDRLAELRILVDKKLQERAKAKALAKKQKETKKQIGVSADYKLSIRAADPLSSYKKKRDFDETSEPEGKVEKGNKHRFVIQKHDATNLHFDLRLENDKGTMQSWAVPKHKLPEGKEKLLAIQTEDHPVEYNKFEGEIEEGYGKGHVDIWASGKYEPIEVKKDKIVFEIKNGPAKGKFVLFRTDGKRWMFMRKKEE